MGHGGHDDTQHANDGDDDLLKLLQSILPGVSSYETLQTIVQANAEGKRLIVFPQKRELFVKRVVASSYCEHKQWADLRRTLLYARTEVRFYNTTLPLLESKGRLVHMVPKCHHATYDLEGLICEQDRATNAARTAPSGNGNMDGRGGWLVLDVMGEGYKQDSPLTSKQASQCLSAVAKLHAAAWEDPEILELADEQLSLGSYHLKMRNPKELRDMLQSWENFMSNFREQAPELFTKASVQNLGRRVADMAEYISDQLTPGPTDPYATLVHGDFKAMNVFLPKDPDGEAVMIDFASTGVGIGMSDVAMHIIHAVRPSDGSEDELIRGYLDALHEARVLYNHNAHPYPEDIAFRQYRLAYVDYFRFMLGRFWKSASMESFESKRKSKNTTLVNRDVDAAMVFVAKVDKYLEVFEKERAEAKELSPCEA